MNKSKLKPGTLIATKRKASYAIIIEQYKPRHGLKSNYYLVYWLDCQGEGELHRDYVTAIL